MNVETMYKLTDEANFYSFSSEPVETREPQNVKEPEAAKIRIGGTNWGTGSLIGKLYPPGTKTSNYLKTYSRHFDTIELDISFYKNFSEADIKKWVAENENQHFRFCPIMYKRITHGNKLLTESPYVSSFFKNLKAFKTSLGPLIIQMPNHFAVPRMEELFDFLDGLPKLPAIFIELPHITWYKRQIFSTLCHYLKQKHIGLVIKDNPDKPGVLHSALTIPRCVIHFETEGDLEKDEQRLQVWAEILKTWRSKGLKDAYFFIQGAGKDEVHLLQYMQELVK